MYINGDTSIMIKVIEIHDALMSLLPENTIFSVEDNDYTKITIQTEGVVAPTQTEVETEIARLQALEDAVAYKSNRADAYPTIGDQLDMLYHAINNNETLKTDFADFYNAVKAVKDQYPKE